MAEVTDLLQRMRDGDRAALAELMPLVYDELRRIAASYLRGQPAGHSLQPTAVVHEAFLKLFQQSDPQVADRAHFLALMARVMRQVLIDHARAQVAAKRGGGSQNLAWASTMTVGDEDDSRPVRTLDVHRALEALEREEPSLAQVVELYYFGGMTAEEASLALGRSVHVVRHELRLARAWLRRELTR